MPDEAAETPHRPLPLSFTLLLSVNGASPVLADLVEFPVLVLLDC